MKSNPQSLKPFRARRVGHPQSVIIANNRGVFDGRPGVYRLQAIAEDLQVNPSVVANRHRMFFAVAKTSNPLDSFPLTVTILNVRGEYLPVDHYVEAFATYVRGAAHCAGYPVEVELHEGEWIHFWDLVTDSRVKIVQVDELSAVDRQINEPLGD